MISVRFTTAVLRQQGSLVTSLIRNEGFATSATNRGSKSDSTKGTKTQKTSKDQEKNSSATDPRIKGVERQTQGDDKKGSGKKKEQTDNLGEISSGGNPDKGSTKGKRK
jgi:hypothetical protein